MGKQASAMRQSYNAGFADEPPAEAAAITPGKRTLTQQHHGGGGLHTVESRLAAIRDRQLPALRAALASKQMEDARTTARLLRYVLMQVDQQLESARAGSTDTAVAKLAELVALRDVLRAEADPLLAQAPEEEAAATAANGPDADDSAETHARAESAAAGASAGIDAEACMRIPDGPRRRLEGAAGASLEGVRLHRGPAAHALASSYGARAVTIGQDIHFGDGELDGDADEAELLLAHEVAHTIQQRSSSASPALKQLRATSETDPAELEADRFAAAAVAGRQAAPISQSLGDVAALKKHKKTSTSDADLDRQPAPLVIEPDHLVFAKTAIGTEATAQTIFVGNAGASPVTIEDVAISSSKLAGVFPTYAEASFNEPMEPGASVPLQFAFRPTAEGHQSASYNIITDGGVRSGGVQLEGSAFSNERSELPIVKASKKQLKFQPTETAHLSPPQLVELTNNGDQAVTIESVEIKPKKKGSKNPTTKTEFVPTIQTAVIEPGASTQISICFKPEHQGMRLASLVVTGNQGAKLATVKLRGKCVSAETARYQGALRGETGPTETYDDMLTALHVAKTFTEKGDKENYQHGYDVLDPVVTRLDALAPKMEQILRDYGSANLVGLTMWGEAHEAVKDWWRLLRAGSTINADYYIDVFRAGEDEIKLCTGELEDAPDLRAMQDAGKTTAIVVGVAALSLPVAAALVAEAPLLWATAEFIGTRLSIWALANPGQALVLSEILLNQGIVIGEGGWEAFADQFTSWEGFLTFIAGLWIDAANLSIAHEGTARSRNQNDGADDAGTPTPRGKLPGETGTDAPPAPKKQGGKGGGGAASDLTPEEAEQVAKTVAKAKAALDEIEVRVKNGKAPLTTPLTAKDDENINRVLALDPEEGQRLIDKYGDELTEHLRYNPLTTLEELDAALTRSGARVRERVEGFYEGVDSEEAPKGWTFDTTEDIDPDTGAKLIMTKVRGPNGENGYFERAYNEKTQEIELRMAFLKLAGQEVAIPGIVKKQGNATEMIAGKGSPTVQYVTVYQLKRLGVPTGWSSAPSVKMIHMSDIQNVETVVHLHWLRSNANGEKLSARALLSVHTASLEYAETTAKQTGYTFAGPPEISRGSEKVISWLLDFQEGSNATRMRENDAILEKYGYTRDTKMLVGFDIDIPVRPTP